MKDRRRGGRAWRGTGAQGRAGTRPAVEGDVGMADTGRNPQRRERGQWHEQIKRRSTAAQTGADGAAGQRDAGGDLGTADRVGQNEKTNMMLNYRRNGVQYWSAGGVRRAAARSRAASPGALAGILNIGSSPSRTAGGDVERHCGCSKTRA